MAATQNRFPTTSNLLRKVTLTPQITDSQDGERIDINGRPYAVCREGAWDVFSHLDESGLDYLKAAAAVAFPTQTLSYELIRTAEGYVEAHIKIR